MLFTSTYLFSHPHFFIDSKISFEDEVIKTQWLFDRLNSRVLMFDFDLNGNRVFDENEKEEFIKTHFKTLKDRNYNIILSADEEYEIEPQNIQLNVDKKRISLSFDINVQLGDFFTMCTMDEKIYMAYRLIESKYKNSLEIQKSEYDFCIGVSDE